MRRMTADRRLSALVAAGADVEDHLWHLAHPAVTSLVLARLRERPEDDERAGLTPQERQILDLIAEGVAERKRRWGRE